MKRPRPAAAVDASAPLALDALLESSVPLVLEGRARGSCWVRLWPALEARGQRLRTAFRTHRADGGAPRSVREAECAVVSATLGEFSAWARGEKGCAAFEGLGSAGWAYADYKRWHELFGEDDEAAAAAAECVDWDALVAGAADAVDGPSDSTLWFGSRGAHSALHQDTYGANIVVQLVGEKRWRLWPPAPEAEVARELRPRRIPYEESSVFAGVDPRRERDGAVWPDAEREVTLRAGDVLFVPKHWWHDVEVCSPLAVSANAWVALASDDEDRVREALARVLVGALMGAADEGGAATAAWLNPTETALHHDENMQMLRAATGRDDLTTEALVNVVAGPAMLARIAAAVGRGAETAEREREVGVDE